MAYLSIIIPVYNTEDYLVKCLDSVKSQTFTDWECILVDDGSTDNSGNICDDFSNIDNRFKVIHQKKSGVSIARNTGLNKATGEWITFLDSDDWINPNCYETALKYKSEANIIQWDNLSVSKSGMKLEANRSAPGLRDLNATGKTPEYFCVIWDKIYKADVIKSNDIEFRPCQNDEDVMFIYEVLAKSPVVYCIPELLINHRIINGSLAHRVRPKEDEEQTRKQWFLCMNYLKKMNAHPELVYLAEAHTRMNPYARKLI